MDADVERRQVALGLLAVAVAYWAPAFVRPLFTGAGDWQMIHHNWEVGYVALTRHGQWPLWDPYHCGGITMWGNPEAQHLSPFFFLSFVAGTTLAIKAMVVAHSWLGLFGMYVLGRKHFELSAHGAVLAAVVWACSGFFTWHVGGGHGTFAPFHLTPWVLLAWRASTADLRMSGVLALVMALVAFEGGTYPFPYLVLLLAFDAVVLLARGPDWAARGRVVGAAVLSGTLTLMIASVRWIPSLITLGRIPRDTDTPDVVVPWEIPEMLVQPRFPWFHPDHPFVWPEYSAYIGAAAAIVGLLGVHTALSRRRYEPLAGLLAFGTLMAGQFAEWAPWSLLHELPIYRALRIPSRFSVLFTFYFALLAGMAIDRWLPRLLEAGWVRRRIAHRPRLARALPWIIVAALVIDPVIYGIVHGARRWHRAPIETDRTAERFHLVPGKRYAAIYASLPRRNQGTRACYVGNLDWPISLALWSGDRPQARLSRTEGEVLEADRAVNTVHVRARLDSPGRLVINQNFDPDWRADQGEVVEDRQRLAVKLPAGTHEVVLRYEPPYLTGSLVLAGTGTLLSLLLLVPVARRRLSERNRGRAAAPAPDR